MKKLIASIREKIEEFFSPFVIPLKRIRFHKKEIIACLLLGVLFSKVDKAQHFFSSFASAIEGQEGNVWAFFFVFIGNGITVIWLSYVFWHKPKKMKSPWIKAILGKASEKDLNAYQEYYEKPQAIWWLAAASSMPILLTSLALSVALMKGNDLTGKNESVFGLIQNYPGTTFIVVTLIYFIFALFVYPKKSESKSNDYYLKKCKTYSLFFLGVTIGYGVLFKFYKTLGLNNFVFIEFALLAIFVFIPTILAARFWYMTSNALLTATTNEKGERIEKGKTAERASMINEWARWISYGGCVLFFIISAFYSITTSLWFSNLFFPIAVVLFVFIFYFQLADFLAYNMAKRRFWVTAGTLAVLVLFIPGRKHYDMKFNEAKEISHADRIDIEEYYLKWLGKHMEGDSLSEKSTFYLVAAEGGGSRSGAWTSSVLTQLDKKSGGIFRNKCFAISTVSGGTVGTAATISLWDTANKKGIKGSQLYSAEIEENTLSKEQEYIKSIFRRNYVSTAILGLFFHDFIQSMPLLNCIYFKKYSRSDKHQKEEADAISQGLEKFFSGNKNEFEAYYQSDFLNLYYDKNKQAKTGLPLFFPNTARVEDGRRGVLSPINNSIETITRTEGDLDTTHLFVSGIDVIGIAGEEMSDKSIPFSGAVSLSQLFPYVNSTIKVSNKTGRFMDGGAYENMGLTTIGEVFRKLCSINNSPDTNLIKKIHPEKDIEVVKDYMHKCDFKLILIYNSRIDEKSELEKNKNGFQILDPLSGLLATPFSGHTEHLYWQSIQDFSNGCSPYIKGDDNSNNRIFKFPLIEDVKKKEIIMSRWLSQPEMDLIFERAELQVDKLSGEIMGE